MFPFLQSNKGITITIDGEPKMFSSTHPSFNAIVEAVESDDEAAVMALTDIRKNVFDITLGRVEIKENIILVGGREVKGVLVDRILEMVSRGSKAVNGYIMFLDNLMDNPSRTAVNELYLFLEACDLPVTSDGHFLAYKRVKENYTDLHSGNFDNSIGAKPEMPRNEVDDNRDRVCSKGLHFCSYNYLPHFGAGNNSNKVVIVKVNPANVVSIPSDYENAKGRAWLYEVVGEITDWEADRITSWYTDEFDSSDTDGDEKDAEFEGYDDEGYDKDGFNRDDIHRDNFDSSDTDDEFDKDGFDDMGYDKDGFDRDDYDFDGFDGDGYDSDGYDRIGFDRNGYDENGIDSDGRDGDGYNEFGYDHAGYDNKGYDSSGLNKDGFYEDGFDRNGYDHGGYNWEGFNKNDINEDGIHRDAVIKHKLSANKVREIKRLHLPEYHAGSVTLTAIAKAYGVHRETIARIDRGDIWNEVT